jgi:very-short-patch-repair endonuclease
MSPIEVKLYEAMLLQGLSPAPQYRIDAYYVDFAFPDIRLAVEADGAAYHSEERKERDRRRDGFLRSRGWAVMRFHGTTIYHKADNCAFIVRREVEGRRNQIMIMARQKELERQRQREAITRPFRRIASLFRGSRER